MNAWQCQKRLFKAGRDGNDFRHTIEVSLPTTAALYGPRAEQDAAIRLIRSYCAGLAPKPLYPPRYGFRAWGVTMIDVPSADVRGYGPSGADFMEAYLDLVFDLDGPHGEYILTVWQELYPGDFVITEEDIAFVSGAYASVPDGDFA